MNQIVPILATRRILLVEKNVETRQLHIQLLRQLGCEVDLAKDGQDMLARLNSGHPSCQQKRLSAIKTHSKTQKPPNLL